MKEKKRKRIWLRLDNAAKIFPASQRPGWSNVFRISVSFRERIDPEALRSAVARIAPRFPSVCVRLGRGLFWYYLEEQSEPPRVSEEGCQPLLPMNKKEMYRSALRVLYYENRIAVEFFHSVTDGTGALSFVKALAASYLYESKGVSVFGEMGIHHPSDDPTEEELEDAFLRYEGPYSANRSSPPAFHLTGEKERDGYLHVTSASVPTAEILKLAREKGVTVTTLLSAVFCEGIAAIQKKRVSPSLERAVRVQIPVNLRKHFPSSTLRNFVAVTEIGLEKGETDAALPEILHLLHHQMALQMTPRNMQAIFTANVKSEKGLAIRLVPLFLKNLVMRAVFDKVGESKACLCLSNLGPVTLPPALAAEVVRMGFTIGPQAKAPYNCGVLSYGDTTYIHLVRNTVEPELEEKIFPRLAELGLPLTLESNERN